MGSRILHPDVLVLAGGGVLGEAWMSSVLAGVEAETGIDFRGCDHFVGTSAGAIVCALLAAGRPPRGPAEAEALGADLAPPAPDGGGHPLARGLAAAAPLVAPVFGAGVGPGATLRAAALRRVPPGTRSLDRVHALIERAGTRFDGRLRVTGVDLASGRRAVFGAPGAPPASPADAVVASCAIPGYFAPVEIGGRRYVDGGVWSFTNLDAAPGRREARILCLNPIAGARGGASAVEALARAGAALEAAVLRRRGAHTDVVAPDRRSAAAMGPDLMDSDRTDAVRAAGYAQGRTLGSHGVGT